MSPSSPLKFKLFDALKRIAAYDTPERLHRHAEKTYGIDGVEAIEYAYENVLSEAKRAVKDVRIRRPA